MNDSEYSSASLKGRNRRAIRAVPRIKAFVEPKPVSTKAAEDNNRPAGYLDGTQKANKAGVICRHCRQGRVNRPKGLCWGCYYAPGVRDLYPTTSKYARRGVRNFPGAAELPTVPTLALPGTPEKVAVMEQRAKDERALFHPCDARFADDPVTLDWLAEYARRGFTLPETRAA